MTLLVINYELMSRAFGGALFLGNLRQRHLKQPTPHVNSTRLVFDDGNGCHVFLRAVYSERAPPTFTPPPPQKKTHKTQTDVTFFRAVCRERARPATYMSFSENRTKRRLWHASAGVFSFRCCFEPGPTAPAAASS